jgi:hypothetical protein
MPVIDFAVLPTRNVGGSANCEFDLDGGWNTCTAPLLLLKIVLFEKKRTGKVMQA